MKLFRDKKIRIKKSHIIRITIMMGLLGFGALIFIFMNIFTSSNFDSNSNLNGDNANNTKLAHRYNNMKGPPPANHSYSSLFILIVRRFSKPGFVDAF